MKTLCTIAAAVLLALPLRASATESNPADATANRPSVTLESIDARIREIERQMGEILRKLDSLSAFLGDKQAGGFRNVDRRLEDLQRDIDDLKREVRRQR